MRIAFVFSAGRKALRHSQPRYLLACVALAMLAAAPVVTFRVLTPAKSDLSYPYIGQVPVSSAAAPSAAHTDREAAVLPAEHVEMLLAHELAHIRRHDYLVNVLQIIAEAMLFYHPAVWLISGHIRAEREVCCDDVAVAVGGDAFIYACALADLASRSPSLLNASLAANGGSLPERIGRLLNQPAQPRPRSGAAIVATVLLGLGAWGALAQSQPSRKLYEADTI